MSDFEKSPKYLAARDSLPEELHEVYKQFVAEYSFHTLAKYGRGYVDYEILAELIRDGWRPSAQPVKKDKS